MNRFSCIIALCLFLTACVESDIPLSPPNTLSPDNLLIGTWVKRHDGGTTYLHIGNDRGAVKILQVDLEQDGKIKSEAFSASETTINGNTYLSAQFDHDGKITYILMKCRISATDTLAISSANYEFVKHAVETGMISGNTLPKALVPNVQLFGNSAETLRNFVGRNSDQLFTEYVEFERTR